MDRAAPVVQFRGVSKYYGKTPGVLDLDLEVRRGEIFGFLGPNGAGKTTTIRLMMNLIRPETGTIRLFDGLLSRQEFASRRRIGYLTGELALYSHLTVSEWLEYFSRLRGGVDPVYLRTLVERLDCALKPPIRSLSRGNKQKVGLITALMHRPDLLVLDEPTGGLDPLIRKEAYKLLAERRREGGTVFLSSHVLPEVERICDRVGIIRNARLVAVERTETLQRKSLREVTMRFERPVDTTFFSDIGNLRGLSTDGHRLRCRVLGDMSRLMARAAPLGILDITSRQPDLQEIFLAYYGTDDHVP